MADEISRRLVDGNWTTVAADAGGGETFNGGTITEPLSVVTSGTGAAVVAENDDLAVTLGETPAGGGTVTIHGKEPFNGAYLLMSDVDAEGTVEIGTQGLMEIRNDAGAIVAAPLAGDGIAALDVRRGVSVRLHAAPDDAIIRAGELCIWFDQSNGAAKLKLKGKSANGTVVQGEVALT